MGVANLTAVEQRASGGEYEVGLSHAAVDETWDRFVTVTPGGHHLQSSLWAQAKAPLGWRTARMLVTRERQIVAGAQLLYRPLPLIGSVGYVSRGPLLSGDEPGLREAVMAGLRRLCRAHRVQYLVVQPPYHGGALVEELLGRGFRPASAFLEPHPSATVLLDLRPELDALLAAMKEKTRYNIRLAQRKGVTVRPGTAADIPLFHQLLASTGERQGFPIPSEDYFAEMWRIMAPGEHLKLFLAECEGEAVSAALLVALGDSVAYKRGAWSGRHGNRHPNELMHWTAIQWARAQGYRYYDFDGINVEIARAAVAGDKLTESQSRTVTGFKIGFGGRVILTPSAYEHLPNPLLRASYRFAYPRLMAASGVQRLIKWLRTR